MATHDYIINNQTFPSTRTDINLVLQAIVSNNSSATEPATKYAYMMWYDSATNIWKMRNADNDAWISLATFDQVTNTVNFLDSAVSIVGLATSATGTVLTLSDTGTTSTVDLIIDNNKEIRFKEATANGTNYIALKAPNTLASDVTFTLPSADGTTDQVLKTDGSGVLSFTDVSGGIDWQSVQTTGFTASAGNAYPCNTTSAGFTVTLPATPSAGDQVQLVDYAGTFDTNSLVIDPNGEDIEGGTSNLQLKGEREGVILTYIDSTQGWIATSGINEGTDALEPVPYSIDFLVIAGGGGGGKRNGGGGGAGGYRTSTQTVSAGTVITVTVGDGGAGGTAPTPSIGNGSTGSNSSISGSGLTTITSAGGGGGGGDAARNGLNGGSGGGGAGDTGTGGSGNTPSTAPSQGNNGGTAAPSAPPYGGGGGGGSGGVGATGASGGNGGAGTASSITGSSVSRAGGGGAGTESPATAGTGGTGGGGNGTNNGTTGGTGSVNTGSGGGGGGFINPPSTAGNGGAGGKGVVILSMPDGSYSGTTTGSPTVATGVSGKTILTFTGSGSYTT